MTKLYYIFFLLLLGACTPNSEPELFMKASPEKRPSKPPHMPPIEKPLETPLNPGSPLPVPIAPQIGVRVPLQVN